MSYEVVYGARKGVILVGSFSAAKFLPKTTDDYSLEHERAIIWDYNTLNIN